MNWKTERRKLKDLVPYDKNPRILNDKQKKELVRSLKKFSLVEIPVINLDNKIIAGHQRIDILFDIYGGDLEIDVRVPNEMLSEEDFKEYLLRSNRNTGTWDWEKLDGFESDFLLDVGFEDWEVKVDKVELDKIFEDMNKDTKTKSTKEICPCCGNKIKTKVTILKLPVDELNDMDQRKDIASEVSNYLTEKYPDEELEIYVLKK